MIGFLFVLYKVLRFIWIEYFMQLGIIIWLATFWGKIDVAIKSFDFFFITSY